jgi:hypothetical protein
MIQQDAEAAEVAEVAIAADVEVHVGFGDGMPNLQTFDVLQEEGVARCGERAVVAVADADADADDADDAAAAAGPVVAVAGNTGEMIDVAGEDKGLQAGEQMVARRAERIPPSVDKDYMLAGGVELPPVGIDDIEEPVEERFAFVVASDSVGLHSHNLHTKRFALGEVEEESTECRKYQL